MTVFIVQDTGEEILELFFEEANHLSLQRELEEKHGDNLFYDYEEATEESEHRQKRLQDDDSDS